MPFLMLKNNNKKVLHWNVITYPLLNSSSSSTWRSGVGKGIAGAQPEKRRACHRCGFDHSALHSALLLPFFFALLALYPISHPYLHWTNKYI